MSRSRVQVLTLAEIAFTIVFALIILSLPQITEGQRTADELARMQGELKRAQEELAAAKQKIAVLEEQVKSTGKLSNIPPACPGDPLVRITVFGINEFLVGNEHLDAATIEARHVESIRWAEQNKCRHRAVVSWLDSLSASDFDAALKRLERSFRIGRARSVEIP